MMDRSQNNIDLNALVDIISNIAGMMILLACVAIMVREHKTTPVKQVGQSVKPISFPLAYVPKKRSVTLCLKSDRLYELPEKELLEAVSKKTVAGEPVEWLKLDKNGVSAKIELTSTLTGFRFKYKLSPGGGVKLNSPGKIVESMNRVLRGYPLDRYFYVFQVWPESFSEFRDIREYLFECGVEVGWSPRTHELREYDIVYSVGEYDENLATIKAQ